MPPIPGMKGSCMKAILTTVLILMFALPARAAETLNGAGATFPYPVYSAWAYEYERASGARINYQSIGSGGGQRQAADRTVHFGASDDPLAPGKLDELKLYQFPTVIGGVVAVVNIPGLRGALRLDAEDLCGIFMGKIKRWDDAKIKAINPGQKLPNELITVVRRSDGSGTTAVFTAYLAETCPDWKKDVGAGKAVSWPVGIGGKGNEGVSNYVKRTKNSIGYVEFAYAKQNRLNHAFLKNSAGNFVEPGFASFAAAASGADFDPAKHFHLLLINAPGKDAWPIAAATFILLPREKTGDNKKVAAFFDWAFRGGDETAKRLAYVPLPGELKEKVRAYWRRAGIR